MLGPRTIVAFLTTTDYDKAGAFYEGILGLKFIKNDGFAMVLEANGIMIRVSKMAQVSPAQFTVLGWQVTGIENILKGLQQRGVHPERFGFFEQDSLGIWTSPTGDKVAWFKDPDGNILSVSEHV
jgi:catechol 2,3-dioxygenase-like lactoylglutathione lyase family enzyme